MGKIKCQVHDCKYCDCKNDNCELPTITICNCTCGNCPKELTMCDSYKEKKSE